MHELSSGRGPTVERTEPPHAASRKAWKGGIEMRKVQYVKLMISFSLHLKPIHRLCRGWVVHIKKLDDHQYTSVSIWWNKSLGIGVKGKPNKIHKYLMVGITIFRFTSWFLFTWVGKTKIKSDFFAEDGKETISI